MVATSGHDAIPWRTNDSRHKPSPFRASPTHFSSSPRHLVLNMSIFECAYMSQMVTATLSLLSCPCFTVHNATMLHIHHTYSKNRVAQGFMFGKMLIQPLKRSYLSTLNEGRRLPPLLPFSSWVLTRQRPDSGPPTSNWLLLSGLAPSPRNAFS